MIQILHYLKDPKVGELWNISLLWVMQDLYHQTVGLRVLGTLGLAVYGPRSEDQT